MWGSSKVAAGKSKFTWIVELGAILILMAVLIPLYFKSTPVNARNGCKSNLSKIQGVKASWALANQKLFGETPVWKDLFGDGNYIPEAPLCPDGGVYSIGSVGSNPKCSFLSHTL